MKFLTCDRAGHDAENNLGFRLISDDGKAYEFAITPDCFMRLFVMGWRAARMLPKAPDRGLSCGLETDASFAVVNMNPGVVLVSGPLVLSLLLSANQMDYLRSEFDRFAATIKRNQKH